MRTLIIATSLSFFMATSVDADVVYTNFGAGEIFSNAGRGVGAFDPPLINAMPFTVPHDMLLDEIRVAVAHVSEFPPNVLNVAVYNSDIDGDPDSPLETMTIIGAPSPPPFYGVLSADSSLHPRLAAGNDYWMVLSSEGQFLWALSTLGQTGFKYSIDGGVTWKDRNTTNFLDRRSVFSVSGRTVPEPTTLALLAFAGLLAVAGRHR